MALIDQVHAGISRFQRSLSDSLPRLLLDAHAAGLNAHQLRKADDARVALVDALEPLSADVMARREQAARIVS